jgi:diketogulonate reductase-like aldo/keto reductase
MLCDEMEHTDLPPRSPRRRQLLGLGLLPLVGGAGAADIPVQRRIGRAGERVPAVGLGSWITFNVGTDPRARAQCTAVVRAFFAAGGRLIDCSPMYGSSQPVIGEALAQLGHPRALYAAEKVWTGSAASAPAQIEASRAHWGVPRFDLLQVHNLLAWEAQLPLLQRMQAEGRVRHIGISTSEGRRHREVEHILRTQAIDTVQLTYNPLDRAAEPLMDLAQERGVAVIVNRTFREGRLTRALARHPLPAWAQPETGATSWAQLILKFVLAHPAVTCAIPATRQVAHVRENLAAALGPPPDVALRERIARSIAAL